MATIKETEGIYRILESQILPIKGTGLVYPISRNLKNIKTFFSELEEIRKDILDKFTEKDENGKVIEYVYIQNEETKQYEFLLDEEGKEVKATEETTLKGGKIDVKNLDFIKAIEDLEKTEFNNFWKIDVSKLSENQLVLLDGINIEPLLDVVLVDSRENN